MNFFESIFLNIILILFPLLIYLLYLSTNRNIERRNKDLFFSLAIISSFYFLYRGSILNTKLLSILILTIPVLIAYLKNKYIISNVLLVLLILLFYDIKGIWVILLGYVVLDILYFIKNKVNMKDHLFVIFYILTNIIFFIIFELIYNFVQIDFIKIIILCTIYILMTFIVYLMFIIGEKILNYHITFKKLQEEKQIRLSLFKITHEIKNPIAVIKGYLDMMDVKNKNQVERYVPIIKGEIERLLGLLQDFLLVNKSKMDLDIMDVGMLIEDTIDKIETLYLGNNIKINYEDIDDEVFINGDYNRLQQVLINVIKNSMEAITNDIEGIINISVELLSDKVKIIVEDNGIGMNKDLMKKIREPFYTTKARGSGLGVSLSYEIIEAHDGSLIYESKEYVGTKVIIELPLSN